MPERRLLNLRARKQTFRATAKAGLHGAHNVIRLQSHTYVDRDTALRACSTSARIKRVRTDARGQMIPKRRR